jgi:hypothetical protein
LQLLEDSERRGDVSSYGFRSPLDSWVFLVGLGEFSIMIRRINISKSRIAMAVSQVGQYPVSSTRVPETIGPSNNPDMKKAEIVEIVRDLFSAPTVSATVAKPTIHAAFPAKAWIMRPIKRI